jgi:hypothetical protein
MPNLSHAETQRQPPQQRAAPNPENQDRCPPERRLCSAEADRGEDAEERENRDRIGHRQQESRDEMAQQALRIALRIKRGRWLGREGPATDIEKVTAASDAQPLLIVDQPIGDDGEAEPCDDPEHRVGGSRAEPRHETRERAFENGPADAHDPDRADRNGDDNADHDAFQKKRQKHWVGVPGRSMR